MNTPNENLRLLALDSEDLAIISANCQDAIVNLADISYLKDKRFFTLIINRFNWTDQENNEAGEANPTRRRAALHFKCVDKARHINLKQTSTGDALELLSVQFKEKNNPSGEITLVFSGGGEIRLEVECIEAELADLGATWQVQSKPHHELDD